MIEMEEMAKILAVEEWPTAEEQVVEFIKDSSVKEVFRMWERTAWSMVDCSFGDLTCIDCSVTSFLS